MKIGYAGMGIMGHGMAANLLRAGHDLTVWNRTQSRTADLEAAGASVAESPAALAAACDITMMCVSDTPDVEAITLGEAGILEGLGAGKLVVDHSTISASATKSLAETVRRAGADWVDAPVSGGSEGAVRGTLSIMVGGEAAAVARARPFMEAYGSSITHVGPTGSGQMVKLVNQVLVVVNGLAVSEALLLAEAGGLDLEAAIDAVKGGAAGSWMLANRGPQIIERDWRPGFTIDLQQKDLRLVLESADELAVPLPATSLVFQMYRALQRRGLGQEGNHALAKALEEMAGLEIGDAARDYMAKRKLEGKNAVVTGGGGGLGSALGRELSYAGARVALLDIDFGAAVVAADRVTTGPAVPVECDVTDWDSCRAAIAAAEEANGPTDILINNAGLAHRSPFSATDLEVLHRVMDINFWGSVYCTKATLPTITERRGVIAIISSTAGFAPLLDRAGYAASKHALHGLFGTLRSELRGTGVDVMIAAPSSIDTPFRDHTIDGDGTITDQPQQTRVGASAPAEDVAERIVWAIERRRSTVVLGRVGIATRYLNALAPRTYERMMTKKLGDEAVR